MAGFDEQQEIQNDQAYLDGFNMGYDIQKTLENEKLSKQERQLHKTILKAINKVQRHSDKTLGMKDGKKQRQKERDLELQKRNSQERSR